ILAFCQRYEPRATAELAWQGATAECREHTGNVCQFPGCHGFLRVARKGKEVQRELSAAERRGVGICGTRSRCGETWPSQIVSMGRRVGGARRQQSWVQAC